VFDTDDENIALERAAIEQELRKAVRDETLNPHFQPIVNIISGQVEGFEALARWHHPKLGHVSPGVFIPIAEQIGIMEELTDTLLRKAATIAARWPNGLILSFNLSPDQLSKASAGLRILGIIAECGLPPQRFEAEVTETAIMKNVGNARNTIESLRAAGICVALDDFGTGYSSLSQLQNLPLDKIKIDKSFIDRICIDKKIAKVVRSIVEMCECLELRCVAEGIETQDQLDELKLIGCNSGQGYLFSRALAPEKVNEYLASSAPLATQVDRYGSGDAIAVGNQDIDQRRKA
jgi:predicted signal transduction protein with EAL and GGDEF domain